ncbi:S-adenosyl-L-methionine-dependent methyltransferase [Lactifluus volemus]|nr:S-adenosyl-L-methionine-dependent methyltransferase [Lactifluus volemus]
MSPERQVPTSDLVLMLLVYQHDISQHSYPILLTNMTSDSVFPPKFWAVLFRDIPWLPTKWQNPSITTLLRASSLPNSFHTSPRPRYPLDSHPEQQQPTLTSTVNDAEIAHFSRLSALWWDERGAFSLLHKMNAHRIHFIREKVLEVLRAADHDGSSIAMRALEPDSSRVLDVLDVGCGGGILSEAQSARLGANTLAIDASGENIGVASRHASADPGLAMLTFRHASAEVIEHVDNPAAFLRSCAELVKPGGHLFLSTIARTPLSYLLTIVAAEKVFRLIEPGTHTFSKIINPEEPVGFFTKPLEQGARPWISRTYAYGLPTRVEAELRGLAYVPWRGDWNSSLNHVAEHVFDYLASTSEEKGYRLID